MHSTIQEIETTQDAFLNGAFHVLQPAKGGHRAGMDALLLAACVALEFEGRVADFGAGCGVAGMAVAQRCSRARIDLVEVDPTMAELARRGLQMPENEHLANRLSLIEADIAAPKAERDRAGLLENTYDCIITNPPFNDVGHRPSPRLLRERAHQLAPGDLAKWLLTATSCLKANGQLHLIVRPENLLEVMTALDRRFGKIRVRPVHPKQGKEAGRVLVSAVRNSRARLAILPAFIVHRDDGTFTEAANEIFKGRAGIES